MVQEADMTHEALCDITQEERQLREYTLVMMATLDAVNEEAGKAKATAAAAQAELVGRLDSAFFRFYMI
jgi:formyltetrahydrofolate synthetase